MKYSFIIIGRNEGFKLPLALKAVERFIKTHALHQSEVIYVDSDSSDGSVNTARAMSSNIIIVSLKGKVNAAIARNAGAARATGAVFCFVDGDMELQSDFPFCKYGETSRPYVLFSGQIRNIVYNENFTEELKRELYYPVFQEPKREWYFGGLFVIDARLWRQFEGMRTSFVFGEDLDLSMRLGEKGYRLLRFPEVLAVHHTKEKKLGFRDLVRNACYSRGYLYRQHLAHPLVMRRILRSDPTVLILVVSVILSIVLQNAWPVVIWLLLSLAAALFTSAGKLSDRLTRTFQQPLRDILVTGAFLFYYPSSKGNEGLIPHIETDEGSNKGT